MVLLPGMDGTGQLFDGFVEALGSEVRSAVVSYPPDQALDYTKLEKIARSRLPADGPFVLVAESFSGPIAVSIAASAPRGLRALVLCCSFVRNPRPELVALRPFTRFLPVRAIPSAFVIRALLGRFSTPGLRSALARVLTQVSPAALRARIRAVLRVDVVARSSQVRVPVLYLRASEDRVVPRAASRLISRVMPGARIVELSAPHFLLQAAPREAARHIRGFLHEVGVGV